MTSQEFASLTFWDKATYIGTGILDVYGKYKEVTEYPESAQEAEALRIQLAQAEAAAAEAKAKTLKNIVLYGGISVAVIAMVLVLRRKK